MGLSRKIQKELNEPSYHHETSPSVKSVDQEDDWIHELREEAKDIKEKFRKGHTMSSTTETRWQEHLLLEAARQNQYETGPFMAQQGNKDTEADTEEPRTMKEAVANDYGKDHRNWVHISPNETPPNPYELYDLFQTEMDELIDELRVTNEKLKKARKKAKRWKRKYLKLIGDLTYAQVRHLPKHMEKGSNHEEN